MNVFYLFYMYFHVHTKKSRKIQQFINILHILESDILNKSHIF